ncbi:MAG: selenide, water dikinase SelD [Spongiibacteraceae bacterium]
MDAPAKTSPTQDLLLLGGGHSHLAVIKQLGMKPIPGLRITVISRDTHTPYSGMLPGLIAGHYQYDEAHIDLRKLCQCYGVRFFHGEIRDINLKQQRVYCRDRPPVRYDWLSINIGSQPALQTIPGADEIGIAVKPIEGFLSHWQNTLDNFNAKPTTRHVAIVGGGAASIEVALACQFQQRQRNTTGNVRFTLYSATPQLLPNYNSRTQTYIATLLAQRGIDVKLNHYVIKTTSNEATKQLIFDDHSSTEADEIIWAIHAGSPKWPQQTGLDCDDRGFISVNQYLQSNSHSNVFAAGDIAHFIPHPIEKSGVYAVRAGVQLARNIRRAISGQPLQAYIPQRRFLSILMTGDQHAIASRGPFSAAGHWIWRWKDAIDRRFMAMYQIDHSKNLTQQKPWASAELSSIDAIRCGGGDAKVSKNILNRAMNKIITVENPDIIIGLNALDDAAVIKPANDQHWVQSINYFRAFIDDPYLLGRIATNHCLSDIYAMGADPHSALAIATVPYASEKIVEDTLLQLMQGATDSLNEQNTSLIGGHSSEGTELGFGLSVNGTIAPQMHRTKSQANLNQVLILTKPLGTGTLLTANRQGQAQGRWIDAAIEQMLINNRYAAKILHQYQTTACTDITGFGLIGHLLEMLEPSDLGASLQMDAIPVLTGAIETAKKGWLSTLHPDNLRSQQKIKPSERIQHPHYPLLFDPQTSGGLLAAVAPEQADECLQQLKLGDCPQAAVIGIIIPASSDGRIILK